MAALVVLPRERDGVEKIELNFNLANLEKWMRQLRVRRVAVSIPRFKFSSTIELKQTLSELGMRAAFDEETANFSGANGKANDLFIGGVFHEARVDVSESGTEAAGATAVDFAVRGTQVERAQSIDFVADHPFLFSIYERATGSLLFMGRVAEPQA